jgi:hypothetical protein
LKVALLEDVPNVAKFPVSVAKNNWNSSLLDVAVVNMVNISPHET